MAERGATPQECARKAVRFLKVAEVYGWEENPDAAPV